MHAHVFSAILLTVAKFGKREVNAVARARLGFRPGSKKSASEARASAFDMLHRGALLL